MVAEDASLEEAHDLIGQLRGQVDQLNEIVQLNNTTAPAAVAGAAQLYAANGNPAYVGSSGLQMGLTGAQPAFFPVLTATAATLTSLGSFSIPANDADVGAVYEIEIWGNGSQGTTQQALGLQVVFGGSNMTSLTFGTNAAGGASSAFRFRVAGRAICHTTGVGGLWTSYLDAVVMKWTTPDTAISVGNANFAAAFSSESTGTTSVDTTTAQTLGVSAAWGATVSGPSVTSQVAIAKRIC